MPKKNIVIVGGGFSGINALRLFFKLKKSSFRDFRVILIDKKDNFEFLPMLPDVIGGWARPECLIVALKKLADKASSEFVKDEVNAVDFRTGKLKLSRDTLDYEYLLIASGSETDFFRNQQARAGCVKLDNLADAVTIRETILDRVRQNREINVLIVGVGYTGIEIATNVAYLLKNSRARYKIYLLEQAEEILMMVPGWIRKEVSEELKKINIEIICRDTLQQAGPDVALLASGRKLDNAVCIWSAGTGTADFIAKMDVAKERTRIKVSEDLRIRDGSVENVFVSGDAAWFFDNRRKSALRMAVMFSIGQGKIAARNVINSIGNRPLVKYHPVDLGYLIPLAQGKAPGVVIGRRIHGLLGYLMHYYMCFHRAAWENKTGVFRDVFLKGITKRKGG